MAVPEAAHSASFQVYLTDEICYRRVSKGLRNDTVTLVESRTDIVRLLQLGLDALLDAWSQHCGLHENVGSAAYQRFFAGGFHKSTHVATTCCC